MSTCSSFRVQVVSIMEALTKTAVAEITKLLDDGSTALQLEMCRSQRENEALKRKLLLMERELRTVRGCSEGVPDNSLNISFEVQICDEFGQAQSSNVPRKGSISDNRLIAGPTKDDQNAPMETEKDAPGTFDIKYEPVDGEQDWSESLRLKDKLEEDTKRSQSQAERKISEAHSCGASGPAAANSGEGPLCEMEELLIQPCPTGDTGNGLPAQMKQEPEGEPLTPGCPQLGSAEGLEVQFMGTVLEKHGMCRESSGHGGVCLDEDFSPPQCRVSRRLRSESGKGPTSHLKQQQTGRPRRPPNEIPGSSGDSFGSAPCEAHFDTSAEARSHRIVDGQELICTHCGKTFLDPLQLKAHKELHGMGKRFSCSECGKGFAYCGVLEKHLQTHSRKKPFSCSECSKSFSQLHVLQAHESTHRRQKLYVCTECGKHFPYKGYLKIHQRVHTREKPFTCEQCGKCFSQISNLKTHQITHTREKCFSCTVCSKSFAYLHVLKHHQRVHTGEKSLICKLCGKIFDSAEALKQHRLVHRGGKRFSCAVCGKAFTAKSSLQSHQSVHTGEKPYLCNECGKSFAHLCNLKTHQRVHTGEKPYSCTVCGKSFSQNHVLQKHILTHS